MSIRQPVFRLTSGGRQNMKYILLIYHGERTWDERTETERRQIYREYRELIDELKADGKYLAGDQLQSTSTANSVRVRGGKPMVTDGPFAETREQLGGFFLIEANNLEEANAIAARIPSAKTGTIEVRTVVEAAAVKSA